jgi:hypothetical protein
LLATDAGMPRHHEAVPRHHEAVQVGT